MKFSELKLNDRVLEALDAMRFDECTPVQEQTIPVILDGKDLIAVAQTGTGKTAAFLLPVLNKLSEGGHPEDAINCIVMSPTRELAQQIDQQMEGFSYFMRYPVWLCMEEMMECYLNSRKKDLALELML